MTILYLVRHGVTQSNIEGKHIGQREEDLTEEGRHQAWDLAQLLRNERLDAIYSSPLRRAVDTAVEIARHHPTLVIVRDPRLNELNLGIFDGYTSEEARRLFRDNYKSREDDKFGFRIPNGESYRDLMDRVKPFVDEVMQKFENDSVCVVGHQGLNRALLGWLVIPEDDVAAQVPYIVIPHDAYIKVTKTPSEASAVVISPVTQHGLEGKL